MTEATHSANDRYYGCMPKYEKGFVLYGMHNGDGLIRYIGQTNDLNNRLRCHKYTSLSDTRRTHLPINRWLKKHGWDSIQVVVLSWCDTEEELNRAEMEAIASLRAQGANLLNVTDGGDGIRGYRFTRPRPVSEETRKKLSEAGKGRKHTPETLQKMREVQRARPPKSEEHRRKISESLKGKRPSAETRAKLSASRTGKPRSPETRAAISAGNTGKKHSAESRARMADAQRKRFSTPEGRERARLAAQKREAKKREAKAAKAQGE